MDFGQETIESIARSMGKFSSSFIRQAQDEAREGRIGMLQAIEGAEGVRGGYSRALEVMSQELYTSQARFLMEIIQNADDNLYSESVTPTLHITVTPYWVKIECNENGFEEENIRALCDTGRSSKGLGTGYIGEKGIGFKSVFKVAKRAHIRSPPYFFQLDQDRELGMITPQWDKAFFRIIHRNTRPPSYSTVFATDQGTLQQPLRLI